jgi:Mor family transcriptional regulator
MKKIVEEKVDRNKSIKKSVKNGKSTRDLAKKYGISNKRVWDIANKDAPKKKKGKKC